MQASKDATSTTPPAQESQPPQTYIWEETLNGLCIRFPAPSAEPKSVGCAIAILIAAALPLSLLVIVATSHVYADVSVTSVLVLAVASVVTYAAMRHLLANVRAERTPPPPVYPSVLTILDGILKIERAGTNRDMDVSWELPEIADIRLCPTHEYPLILGPSSLLKTALSPPDDDLVRISVMHPSGQVDDVTLRAPGRHWIDELERRLRAHLHIPPDGQQTTPSSD